MVEFALVLPLLLLVLLGIVDFGQAFAYKNDETHLANSAARYVAVNACSPCGGQTVNTYIKTQAESAKLRDPSTGINVTIAFADTNGKFIGDTGYLPGSPALNNHCTGASVKVKIQYNYSFLGFLGVPPVGITGSSTTRLEQDWKGNAGTGVGSGTDHYNVVAGTADSTNPNC